MFRVSISFLNIEFKQRESLNFCCEKESFRSSVQKHVLQVTRNEDAYRKCSGVKVSRNINNEVEYRFLLQTTPKKLRDETHVTLPQIEVLSLYLLEQSPLHTQPAHHTHTLTHKQEYPDIQL